MRFWNAVVTLKIPPLSPRVEINESSYLNGWRRPKTVRRSVTTEDGGKRSMGCHNSKVCGQVSRKKKKNKAIEGVKQAKEIINLQDGSAVLSSEEEHSDLENQLKAYEWQLKILHAILTASGDQERDQLLKDHPGDICTLVYSITEKVKTEITADLHDLHEKQMRSTREQHQRETEELQQLHDGEKNVLNESHAAALNALKDQIESLTSELHLFNELKRRAEESMLRRDLQRNIETHGSPGVFWEQEQESLLFVIEMKRERLQDQGNKLLQMEELVEKNLALEDQLLHALQQNEDFRVRIDNYQSLIQQLSKEQNDLQEALEKQSLQSQKLSLEKEELIFKLIHRRDSCSSFHLPSVIATEMSPS
ncbi:coiled-coil domain-containing protein 69 [Triplophysa dalaica]|uniref:coiled-coil domain-containing protein 69 n=1 Tax=Triplophysa dalaica TaxID=1582913 RepID=UPI0024DFB7F7|nr:coiled-coil domain-containing protein 69 [Triplophysa dalaica]